MSILYLVVPAAAVAVNALTKPLPRTVDSLVQTAAPDRIGQCVKIEKPAALIAVEKESVTLSAAWTTMPRADYDRLVADLQARWASSRAEFLAERERWRAQGWAIHDVEIATATKTKVALTLTYRCPPGSLPVEWEALIETLEKNNVCTQERMVPSAVRETLLQRGWASVQPPMSQAPPGYAVMQMMPPRQICPPGVRPIIPSAPMPTAPPPVPIGGAIPDTPKTRAYRDALLLKQQTEAAARGLSVAAVIYWVPGEVLSQSELPSQSQGFRWRREEMQVKMGAPAASLWKYERTLEPFSMPADFVKAIETWRAQAQAQAQSYK